MKKKSGVLKVASVLMMIGGIFSILAAIVAIAGVGLILSSAGLDLTTVLSIGLMIVMGGLQILAAASGLKLCKNGGDATMCSTLSIIVLGVSIVNLICGFISTGITGIGSAAFNVVCSLLLPVLYFIGAKQMEKED